MLRIKIKHSLIKKILIFFTVFTVFPTVLLGVLGYTISERIIVSNSSKMMQAILEQNVGRIRAIIQEFHQTQINVANSSSIITQLKLPPAEGAEANYYNELQKMLRNSRYTFNIKYINWYPYNMQGHDYYSRYAMNKAYSSEQWYQDPSIMRGEVVWAPEIITNYGFEEWVITRYRAIRDPGTLAVYGVLGLSVSEQTLSREIYLPQNLPGQRSVVLDSSGRIIIDTGHSDHHLLQPLRMEREKTKHGAGYAVIEGEAMFVTRMKVPETEWSMMYFVPESSLLQQLAWIRLVVLALCLCYLGVATAFGFYMHQQMMKPIQKLVRWMRQVEQGNLAATETISENKGEMSFLFISFRRLIHQLKSQINTIRITERQKREMEIKALNYQIRPHFIYNTLDSIKWKSAKHKSDQALDMIESFSGLLRTTLSGGSLVTIEEEIQHIKYYVELEKSKHENRFDVIYDIVGDILALKIPRLLLQPLVENAIRHGVLPGTAHGLIIISIRRQSDQLVFTITDNGPGFALGTSVKGLRSDQAGSGIGLENIRKRLQLYYPDHFQMDIGSNHQGGAEVRIAILLRPLLETQTDDFDSVRIQDET